MAQGFQSDGDSMRLIDQVCLLGKTWFRTGNTKEAIIPKYFIGPHIGASCTLHKRRMADRKDAKSFHITT
jgi:hypothetical protein